MKTVLKKAFILAIFCGLGIGAQAQQIKDLFISSTDNAFDVSGFLNTDVGFLPVPIVITDPTLGFGGGMAGVHFHKKKGEDANTENQFPPKLTAVAGAYTSNNTWVTMLAHQGSYLQDRLRYTGALGYLSINLDYYNRDLTGDDQGLRFNMKGFLTHHEILFRPKAEMPLFVGLNYSYFNNQVGFKTGLDIPGLEKLENETNHGGMNAVWLWDTRDNTFTPTKGLMNTINLGLASKYLGGDNEYWYFNTRNYAYFPIKNTPLFSSYRLNLESKWGDVPFYELPFINLRGIPMLRYQGNHVAITETEWRYQAFDRWSVIAFAGAGVAMDNYSKFLKTPVRGAGGAGFRYLIAKEYGIHAGLDVAKGPEQWAWYLTIGSNWIR